MKIHSTRQKYIGVFNIIIIISFLLSDTVWPYPYRDASHFIPFISHQGSTCFYIPSYYGDLINRSNGIPEVVIIGDAHCNYTIQKNIAQILKILVNQYGFGFIGVEGSNGIIDVTRFSRFIDRKRKEIVLDKFVRDGYVTGPEFLKIVEGEGFPVELYGLEDVPLYKANFNSLKRHFEKMDWMKGVLEEKRRKIERLKEERYNPELKEFDRVSSGYREGCISLTDFLKKGFPIVVGRISLGKDLRLLMECIELEDMIDFNEVEKERDALIEKLMKDLPKEDARGIVRKGLEYRLGRLSGKGYYSYLAQFTDFKEAKNLRLYVDLVSRYEDIDRSKLFFQIEEGIDRGYEVLARTDGERALIKMDRGLFILNKAVGLMLSPSEYKYFRLCDWDAFLENFLSFTCQDGGVDSKVAVDKISQRPFSRKDLQEIEEFYRLAERRDSILLENLLAHKKDKKAVIITGGFHVDGITRILDKRKIPYAVIMPNGDGMQDGGGYFSILREIIGNKNLALPTLLDPNNPTTEVTGFSRIAEAVGSRILQELQADGAVKGYIKKHLQDFSPGVRRVLEDLFGVRFSTGDKIPCLFILPFPPLESPKGINPLWRYVTIVVIFGLVLYSILTLPYVLFPFPLIYQGLKNIDDPIIRMQRAFDERQFEAVLRMKEQVLRYAGSNPRHLFLVHNILATTYNILMQFDSAIHHYKEAIRNAMTNREKISALIGLGYTYISIGRYRDGKDVLNKAKGLGAMEEKNFRLWIPTYLGIAHFHLGEYKDARENLLLGVSTDNISLDIVYGYLGLVECHEGNNEEALRYFDLAYEFSEGRGGDSTRAMVQMHKAIVYLRMQDSENAKNCFERGLKFGPKIINKNFREFFRLLVQVSEGKMSQLKEFLVMMRDIWKGDSIHYLIRGFINFWRVLDIRDFRRIFMDVFGIDEVKYVSWLVNSEKAKGNKRIESTGVILAIIDALQEMGEDKRRQVFNFNLIKNTRIIMDRWDSLHVPEAQGLVRDVDMAIGLYEDGNAEEARKVIIKLVPRIISMPNFIDMAQFSILLDILYVGYEKRDVKVDIGIFEGLVEWMQGNGIGGDVEAMANFYLGNLYYMNGDIEKAWEHLLEAVRLGKLPDLMRHVYYNLAVVCAKVGQSLGEKGGKSFVEKGISYAERAIQLGYDEPNVLILLLDLYREVGDYIKIFRLLLEKGNPERIKEKDKGFDLDRYCKDVLDEWLGQFSEERVESYIKMLELIISDTRLGLYEKLQQMRDGRLVKIVLTVLKGLRKYGLKRRLFMLLEEYNLTRYEGDVIDVLRDSVNDIKSGNLEALLLAQRCFNPVIRDFLLDLLNKDWVKKNNNLVSRINGCIESIENYLKVKAVVEGGGSFLSLVEWEEACLVYLGDWEAHLIEEEVKKLSREFSGLNPDVIKAGIQRVRNNRLLDIILSNWDSFGEFLFIVDIVQEKTYRNVEEVIEDFVDNFVGNMVEGEDAFGRFEDNVLRGLADIIALLGIESVKGQVTRYIKPILVKAVREKFYRIYPFIKDILEEDETDAIIAEDLKGGRIGKMEDDLLVTCAIRLRDGYGRGRFRNVRTIAFPDFGKVNLETFILDSKDNLKGKDLERFGSVIGRPLPYKRLVSVYYEWEGNREVVKIIPISNITKMDIRKKLDSADFRKHVHSYTGPKGQVVVGVEDRGIRMALWSAIFGIKVEEEIVGNMLFLAKDREGIVIIVPAWVSGQIVDSCQGEIGEAIKNRKGEIFIEIRGTRTQEEEDYIYQIIEGCLDKVRSVGYLPLKEGEPYYSKDIMVNGGVVNIHLCVEEAKRAVERYKEGIGSDCFQMDVNNRAFGYRIIMFKNRYFVVREDLLNGMGYSPQDFQDILSYIEREEDKLGSGFSFGLLPELIVIEEMTSSSHLGENCTQDQWIGINSCIYRIGETDYRRLLFSTILIHELWHEIRKGEDIEEFLERHDGRFISLGLGFEERLSFYTAVLNLLSPENRFGEILEGHWLDDVIKPTPKEREVGYMSVPLPIYVRKGLEKEGVKIPKECVFIEGNRRIEINLDKDVFSRIVQIVNCHCGKELSPDEVKRYLLYFGICSIVIDRNQFWLIEALSSTLLDFYGSCHNIWKEFVENYGDEFWDYKSFIMELFLLYVADKGVLGRNPISMPSHLEERMEVCRAFIEYDMLNDIVYSRSFSREEDKQIVLFLIGHLKGFINRFSNRRLTFGMRRQIEKLFDVCRHLIGTGLVLIGEYEEGLNWIRIGVKGFEREFPTGLLTRDDKEYLEHWLSQYPHYLYLLFQDGELDEAMRHIRTFEKIYDRYKDILGIDISNPPSWFSKVVWLFKGIILISICRIGGESNEELQDGLGYLLKWKGYVERNKGLDVYNLDDFYIGWAYILLHRYKEAIAYLNSSKGSVVYGEYSNLFIQLCNIFIAIEEGKRDIGGRIKEFFSPLLQRTDGWMHPSVFVFADWLSRLGDSDKQFVMEVIRGEAEDVIPILINGIMYACTVEEAYKLITILDERYKDIPFRIGSIDHLLYELEDTKSRKRKGGEGVLLGVRFGIGVKSGRVLFNEIVSYVGRLVRNITEQDIFLLAGRVRSNALKGLFTKRIEEIRSNFTKEYMDKGLTKEAVDRLWEIYRDGKIKKETIDALITEISGMVDGFCKELEGFRNIAPIRGGDREKLINRIIILFLDQDPHRRFQVFNNFVRERVNSVLQGLGIKFKWDDNLGWRENIEGALALVRQEVNRIKKEVQLDIELVEMEIEEKGTWELMDELIPNMEALHRLADFLGEDISGEIERFNKLKQLCDYIEKEIKPELDKINTERAPLERLQLCRGLLDRIGSGPVLDWYRKKVEEIMRRTNQELDRARQAEELRRIYNELRHRIGLVMEISKLQELRKEVEGYRDAFTRIGLDYSGLIGEIENRESILGILDKLVKRFPNIDLQGLLRYVRPGKNVDNITLDILKGLKIGDEKFSGKFTVGEGIVVVHMGKAKNEDISTACLLLFRGLSPGGDRFLIFIDGKNLNRGVLLLELLKKDWQKVFVSIDGEEWGVLERIKEWRKGYDRLDIEVREDLEPYIRFNIEGGRDISLSRCVFRVVGGDIEIWSPSGERIRYIKLKIESGSFELLESKLIKPQELVLIVEDDLSGSNTAVATPGMYTPHQHRKTNEWIRDKIQGLERVNLQRVRPQVWETLDNETKQALRDVVLFFIPPQNPQYPYYLRTETIDGRLQYQVAHAGTNQGQGRFIYMTEQAFMELPPELVARILEREVRLTGERLGGNKTAGGYSDEVKVILSGITSFMIYKELPQEYKELMNLEEFMMVFSTGRIPDDWPRLENIEVEAEGRRVVDKIEELGNVLEVLFNRFGLVGEIREVLIKAFIIKLIGGEENYKDILSALWGMGYGRKSKEVVSLFKGIKKNGNMSRVDYYFLRALEEILGYPEGSISVEANVSQLKGKPNSNVEKWVEYLRLNIKGWELLELFRGRHPKGVIVQDIKDLGPELKNWLVGIQRYNVDMKGVRMVYLVDGISREDLRVLKARKPKGIEFIYSLEELNGDRIVYLARKEKLMGLKGDNRILLVECGNAGGVIELSLCLYLLDRWGSSIKETIEVFLDKLVELGLIRRDEIKESVVDGIIKLPPIKPIQDMWGEIGEGATYLDMWA